MRTLAPMLTCLLVIGFDTLGRDLTAKPLRIEGAKVAAETDVKRLAFSAYVDKMPLGILASEGVQDFAIVKLGYDIPGFAAKGERIWEARVTADLDELRAILWVNPRTEAVHFVCGPWDSVKK